MNPQLNQLQDRVERWAAEPLDTEINAHSREIIVIAQLLLEIVENLKAIDARLEKAEGAAKSAANVASCLANGIKPD